MNKKYLVWGLGRSGISVANFLMNKKTLIFLYDNDENVRTQLSKRFSSPNIFFVNKVEKKLIDNIDEIIISPGIPSNALIKYAIKQNKKVISELELGYLSCKNNFIAITGTNGKTTVSSLVQHIFEKAKKKSSLVGNIGVPVTAMISKTTKKDVFVCEVSSFQLERIERFKPKIAAITNLGVDHLDRYKTEKEYINAKLNILKNLNTKSKLVLNNECKYDFKELTNAQLFYFGFQECNGCYAKDGYIFFCKEKIMPINDIKLLGRHNLENVLCAVLIAKLWHIKNKKISDAVKSFLPPPHRLQKVVDFDGVVFVDDSKATTIESTLVAVKSFSQPIVLLLCGNDKGYDYNILFKELTSNVRLIITCGDISRKVLNASKNANFTNIIGTKTLKDAVKIAVKNSISGDVVLLSPSTASFDEFENYADRGLHFEQYVRELTVEK